MITRPTVVVEVDWNADDDYGDTGENVTSDVRSFHTERGRDKEWNRPIMGNAMIKLRNEDDLYSPSNSSGALFGNLKPNRKVRIRTTAPETVNLFTGRIKQIRPTQLPSGFKECTLHCVDGFDLLATVDIETEMQSNQNWNTIIGLILDAAGWPAADRTLDTGQFLPPRWWAHNETALRSLQQVERTEFGLIYIDGSGNLVFEDRHHRLKSPHFTSQATFDDTMSRIIPDYDVSQIFNYVIARVSPRALASSNEIWRLRTDIKYLSPSESVTIYADLSAPAENIVTPAANTDYTANAKADGSGTDKTSDLTVTATKYAQQVKLVLTNTDATNALHITLLKLRGQLSQTLNVLTYIAEDSSSQTTYGKRKWNLDAPLFASYNIAKDYCDWQVDKYKDDFPYIQMVIQNKDSTNLSQILLRNISDRITVQATDMGINDEYFIEKVSYDYSHLGLMSATWNLMEAGDTRYCVLDDSDYGKLDDT